MKTAAQQRSARSAAAMLEEALAAIPRDQLAGAILSAAYALPDAECEELGNRIGRIPSDRVRGIATWTLEV